MKEKGREGERRERVEESDETMEKGLEGEKEKGREKEGSGNS